MLTCLCIICQDKKSSKTIVKIPSQESVKKIYRSIELRAENGESYYVTLQSKVLSGNLSKSETVYRRECHKNIGNITFKRKPDSKDTSELGGFKYHTPCWVKYVDRGVDESLNVNKHNYNFHEDKMKECIEFETLQRVEYSLNNGDVLSIRSIVEEYGNLGHNISDDRSYSRKRKIWKENILQRIPQAEIQHRISTNTPECIFQNIHKGLIIEAAIENAECQENSLKRMWSVAKDLREDSLSFIRCKLEFDGEVKPESLRQPDLLVSFLKWFLTGVEKQIDGERGKHLHSVVR